MDGVAGARVGSLEQKEGLSTWRWKEHLLSWPQSAPLISDFMFWGVWGHFQSQRFQALVALRRPHLIFQLQNINFKQTDSQELKLFNQSSNSYLCLPCCSLSGNFHPLCHLSISSSPVEIIAKGLRSLHTRALAHRKSKPNRDVSKRPFLDGAGTPRVACFMKIFHKTVIIRYF